MSNPFDNRWDHGNGRYPPRAHRELRDAESIQHRMAELRRELQSDAVRLTHKAEQATHLRYYVKRFPLACAGIALLAGYALVPAKKQVVTPSQDQLQRLVKNGDLKLCAAPQTTRQGGLLGSAIMAVGAVMARAGIAYVGQQVGQHAAPPDRQGRF